MDIEVIETKNNFRAIIITDESAEQPYDDGATPILTIANNGYGTGRVEAFNRQAEEFTGVFNELWQRFELEDLERFARIFLGAKGVSYWHSAGMGGYYFAFDTDKWAEEVGCPEDRREVAARDSLKEVQAWAEGDVWGVAVQELVTYTKTYSSGDEETGEEWVTVDDTSVWGFYGAEYAEQQAREELDRVTADK